MHQCDSHESEPAESLVPALPDTRECFARVVAPLARGELRIPAPFDHASSAALALNDTVGDVAQHLFDVVSRRPSQFRIRIHEISDDLPGDDREVMNTIAASPAVAAALLFGLAQELVEGGGDD